MKKWNTVAVLAILGLCLAITFWGCSSGSSSTSQAIDLWGGGSVTTPASIVHITANVTTPTTWTHDNVYVIDNSIITSATLTIEPGTIVKFEQGRSITVGTNGSIFADGQSAATPIVFTSIKDDVYGGDTNGDGSATTPARGDWGYINVTATGSRFNYCGFGYAGSAMPYTGTLRLTQSATVTNCVFARNQGGTLTDRRAAALNASLAGAGTILSGNTFYDNDMPLVINSLYDVDNTNVFHKIVSGSTITNKYNGIFWEGNYSQMGNNITWSNTEVPYVIVNPISVVAGSSLTLADNVIVKFDTGQRIDVPGTLIADATTGIMFTSLKDDSVGGDTNGDGTATAPAPGDWKNVSVTASGSVFDHCSFFYGGSGKPYSGTLEVGSAYSSVTATITNCTFAHNTGGTVADNRAATVNLGASGAGTVITGNTFYDNDMPLVINGLQSVDNSNVFHIVSNGTTTVTNKYNGIFLDGTEHQVDGNVTWSNTEVPYVIYNTTLMIGGSGVTSPAGTLNLGNNVILKLQLARIDLYLTGTINQGTGNYFTSLNDDSNLMLGDTAGDGISTAAKGDWTGINNCQGLCYYFSWGNILYATNP